MPPSLPLGARASHNTGVEHVGTGGGATQRRKPQRRAWERTHAQVHVVAQRERRERVGIWFASCDHFYCLLIPVVKEQLGFLGLHAYYNHYGS